MTDKRRKYVVDLDEFAYEERPAVSRSVVEVIADDIDRAETDLPWPRVGTWPDDVREAAERLRDRFVPAAEQNDQYMVTGMREVTDEAVRRDFVAVAPYAYDASFWADGLPQLASLADEGSCCVLALTPEHKAQVAAHVGEHRVFTLAEWRRLHPSLWRRFVGQFRPGSRHRSGDR